MASFLYTVSEAQLDPIYKHVNHATCLSILEYARYQYLISVGYPSEKLISEGLFIVISKVEVRYLREVFEGEISVTCEEPKIDGKILKLHQKILNDKGKIAVDGLIECQIMLGSTKRAVLPPEEFSKAFLS